MRKKALLLLVLLLIPAGARGYPLDGKEYSGIERLEGYRLATEGQARVRVVPPGARLPLSEVDLRLLPHSALEIPPADPQLSAAIVELLGAEADNYGIAVLDLSDPAQPRYAEHNARETHNPGSVGKLMIALALFQALADVYPDDIAARERVLRETPVTADRFIVKDGHDVPLWDGTKKTMTYRPLRQGDVASLWTYLDWMLSASSNAAASMVLKQAMLLRRFGTDYPVSAERNRAFFADTKKRELSALLGEVLHAAGPRNGIDRERLRQGGFFTWKGKQLVPGTSSLADARVLVEFLLRLEQGKLVDVFSSREIKRLLYMTQKRIRYASHPALNDAAVYFKSGSLYRCRPEPGFVCKKYHGNVENRMNSVAIIESPAGERRLHYLVAVMSNVLRRNSAVEHQTLAMRIHRLIERLHPPAPASRRSDHRAPRSDH